MEGLVPDWLRGIFGGRRRGTVPERGASVEERARYASSRVEQQRAGVKKAAAALPDERQELGVEARKAADSLAGAAGPAAERAVEGEADGDALEPLGDAVEELRRLHYLLVRIEVDPEHRDGTENEGLVAEAEESVNRLRQLASTLESVGGPGSEGAETGVGPDGGAER